MGKKKNILLIISVLFIAIAMGNAFPFFSSNGHSAAGNSKGHNAVSNSKGHNAASNVSADKSGDLLIQKSKKQGLLLKRTAYTLSYDKGTRLPIWVAWYLTREHTYGEYKRSEMKFMEDMEVPAPRATNFDYMQSGYDRGHMCPSGDNRWSRKAQEESFLYTNCCPQLHHLNSEGWNDLEKQCRTWAKRYGRIYIVCGPILYNQPHRTIGKNKVVVPEAFYKVVLRIGKTEKDIKAIGFIYRNEVSNKPITSHIQSVDYIEKITGIDFFPALPDMIENRVEANANWNDWR